MNSMFYLFYKKTIVIFNSVMLFFSTLFLKVKALFLIFCFKAKSFLVALYVHFCCFLAELQIFVYELFYPRFIEPIPGVHVFTSHDVALVLLKVFVVLYLTYKIFMFPVVVISALRDMRLRIFANTRKNKKKKSLYFLFFILPLFLCAVYSAASPIYKEMEKKRVRIADKKVDQSALAIKNIFDFFYWVAVFKLIGFMSTVI